MDVMFCYLCFYNFEKMYLLFKVCDCHILLHRIITLNLNPTPLISPVKFCNHVSKQRYKHIRLKC